MGLAFCVILNSLAERKDSGQRLQDGVDEGHRAAPTGGSLNKEGGTLSAEHELPQAIESPICRKSAVPIAVFQIRRQEKSSGHPRKSQLARIKGEGRHRRYGVCS